MLFGNFKNFHIIRYVIYEFLKKVLGVPQLTCLVRVHCDMPNRREEKQGVHFMITKQTDMCFFL